MTQRNRTSEWSSRKAGIGMGSAPVAVGRAPRPRLDGCPGSPAFQVRRLLVLVARFQELSAQRSDPVRLCDLLCTLILCGRETFMGQAGMVAERGRRVRASAEQEKCLDDLELLLHAIVRGVPDATRGLPHALDGLLVQCVIFEAGAGTRGGGADASSA